MKLQKFLERHAAGMLQVFCLSHYKVIIKRSKIRHQFDVDVDTEYLDARIRYGKVVKEEWRRGMTDVILEGLAHEITHIIIAPITDEGRVSKRVVKAEEQATEHISRLLYRLYKETKCNSTKMSGC